MTGCARAPAARRGGRVRSSARCVPGLERMRDTWLILRASCLLCSLVASPPFLLWATREVISASTRVAGRWDRCRYGEIVGFKEKPRVRTQSGRVPVAPVVRPPDRGGSAARGEAVYVQQKPPS